MQKELEELKKLVGDDAVKVDIWGNVLVEI